MSPGESDGSDRFSEAGYDVEDCEGWDCFGGVFGDVLEGGGEECVAREDCDVFSVYDLEVGVYMEGKGVRVGL